MAGAVLVLQAGTASACIRTDATACIRTDGADCIRTEGIECMRTEGADGTESQQVFPLPRLRSGAGIPGAADRDERKASQGFEEESVLEKWDIDPDDLPQEEIEEIPPVPEEIREYFEEAVADTVEKYDGSTPPAPDLSKYSLRADTIRAGVRAKAQGLMKKESGQILDRMSSFALSFGGPAIAKMAKEMQSQTVGKMTAFGSGQEDEDSDRKAGSPVIRPSFPDNFDSSPSGGQVSGGGPLLSIIPPLNEQPAGQDDGPYDGSDDAPYDGSDDGPYDGSNDDPYDGPDVVSPDHEEVNNSGTQDPAQEDKENRVEEDGKSTGESGFEDIEIFPDLTANFALARPFTSGSLYYKYRNTGSIRSGSGSEEKDDSGDDQDNFSGESSAAETAERRNIVFIGDSRTVGMEMYVGGREDEYWCAKNSMGYSWMVDTAAPSVDNLIGENTDVVILMGVNDLGNVSRYVDYMNEKAAEWKERGARTFFVSVTPVVDSKSPNAKNSRIESFNTYAIEHLRNVHYIDAYNRIRYSFGSPDGIHFDAATYREIYRIIHFYLYQGWYEEAGLRFYFDCGQPLTGWHCLDGSWQYMDGAGVRWISDSRVGDVCLAPYPMTGLTDPDIRVLSTMASDTSGDK